MQRFQPETQSTTARPIHYPNMELTAAAGGPPPESPEVAGGRIDWTPKDVFFGLLAFVGAFLLLPIPFIIPFALIWDDREGRLYWVDSLVNMGARVVLADPHRAVVSGPSALYGSPGCGQRLRAALRSYALLKTAMTLPSRKSVRAGASSSSST